MTKRRRDNGAWRSPQNRLRRSAAVRRRIQKSTPALTKKKKTCKFSTAHLGFFCCRSACIAPVRLQNKVIGDWHLRSAGGIGTCTTHTCSERSLVGEKAKTTDYRAKKRKVAFRMWNILKIEMLEGQKHLYGSSERSRKRVVCAALCASWF